MKILRIVSTSVATAMSVLLATSPALAGDVYVPDNVVSTTSTNVIPMGGDWPTSNRNGEWRYQTQLNAPGIGRSGFITDIAFATCKSGPVLTATGFEIRMSHTTLAVPVGTFAGNLPDPIVVRPSGPFTYTSQAGVWTPVGLRTPFHYNGSDNLTIEIRYRTGSVAGGALTCSTDANATNAPYRAYLYGAGAYDARITPWFAERHGLKVRLTFSDQTITPSGAPRLGQPFTFQLAAPGEGGKPFVAGSSFSEGPVSIGPLRLPLGADQLLAITTGNRLPSIFTQYTGSLDAAGAGSVRLNIPSVPAFVGVKFYTAYIVVDATKPQGIAGVSENAPTTILP